VSAYENVKVDRDYKVECIYFATENVLKARCLILPFITTNTKQAMLEYEDRFKLKYVGRG
jgi:hypothetical protein